MAREEGTWRGMALYTFLTEQGTTNVVSFPDGLHHLSRSHVGVRKSENTKWCYRLVTFGRAGVGKASRALDSASTTSCTVLSIIV